MDKEWIEKMNEFFKKEQEQLDEELQDSTDKFLARVALRFEQLNRASRRRHLEIMETIKECENN